MQHEPYRTSNAESCPRCAAPLPVASDNEPRVCDRGCGEWLSLRAIDEHLCPEAIDVGNDRVFAKRIPSNVRCVQCGEAMAGVPEASLFRCIEHGMWFDAGWRSRLSRGLDGEVARHKDVKATVALLRSGEESDLRVFVRRLLDLEDKVIELERRIE
jgi:hypothetical protein